jgi:hypothetical protein
MEAVYTGQGTRLNEKAPWETYEDELGVRMSSDLAAEVAEYAARIHHPSEKVSAELEDILAEQREINRELSKQYQWLDPDDYHDVGARIGNPMTHAEFITKLRQHKINCHYKQHVHVDKAVLYISRNGLSDPEKVCWVQQGLMPELSIMNFDQYEVPTNERRRGWRTCLLQAILQGFISEEKANKIFGKPKRNDAFSKYNQLLKGFRDQGNKLVD